METMRGHGTQYSFTRRFNPDAIIHSIFFGNCILGCFDGEKTVQSSEGAAFEGIYHSVIANAEIGSNCSICKSSVSHYLIQEKSLVCGVGSLACAGRSSFGNGKRLPIGIETGGRDVLSFAELTLELAGCVAMRRNNKKFLDEYQRFIDEYCAGCALDVGVADSGSSIRNTPTVKNAYIGKNARIDTALSISDCTILSSADEPTEISSGALARASCIQWGCAVSSMAIVDESVLLEHGSVIRHGKVDPQHYRAEHGNRRRRGDLVSGRTLCGISSSGSAYCRAVARRQRQRRLRRECGLQSHGQSPGSGTVVRRRSLFRPGRQHQIPRQLYKCSLQPLCDGCNNPAAARGFSVFVGGAALGA